MKKTANQAVELSKTNDLIRRLRFERDSQEIEIVALKAQVEATFREGHFVGPYQVELKEDAENIEPHCDEVAVRTMVSVEARGE